MAQLQKIKMYYDPLGRVVKTVNPNGSEQWVMRGIPSAIDTPVDPVTLSGVEALIPTPWENYTYDSNDLADAVGMGSDAPSTDWNTPKNAIVDCLGRTVETNEFFDNADYTNTIRMQYSYDVRGNLLQVLDPYGREVFLHKYDLRVPGKDQKLPPVYTKHIDKGISTILFDALGKPIEGLDAKGAISLSTYDEFQRPTYAWAKNKAADPDITLRNYMVYGEGQAGLNVNGKVFQSYDEAGMVLTDWYDFKGNLIQKIRKVIDSAELKSVMDTYDNYIIDWTGLPSILDSTDYQTNMSYDALNRIMELELPTDLDSERKKLIPTYNNAGALEKVDLYSPTGPTTTNYVENIAYNAKGQRLLIAFGNDRMTRYAYDTTTFRLVRQRTEGYSKSVVSNTITYAYTGGTNKQDDGFKYDLIGNILNIFTRVTDCGIGGTPDELDRTFEYDSIYRLTYADGRESDTQDADDYIYTDAPIPSTPLPSNVNYYERNYVYDKLGNINSVVQSGTLGFTRNYTYNTNSNTLQKIENSTPTTIESYTYDDCGNTVTTNLNRYYIWNHADQLLCYKNQASMADPTVFTQYDYAGQDRVSKMVRTGTAMSPIYERTIYIDGIFEYVKLESGSTYEKNYIHIMDDKSRVAEVRINPGTAFPGDISDDVVFILEDQIGSAVVRLSDTGTVIDKEEYYPFGDSSLRTFTYKRYRYVGKEKDSESGLYYYGARYYAAWTCRFISVDPLAKKYNQLTPYNYAGNNPIDDKDIDGMQSGKTPEGGGNQGNNQAGAGAAATAVKEVAQQTKKPIVDNAVKELAKEGAEKAAENGGKAIVKDNIPKKGGTSLGGFLRGLLLGLIHELATSPKLDDVQQFKSAYKAAESKNFENEHANKSAAFWASRIDWKNVNPEDFKDVYLYRAMETKNGNWIISNIKGAPNGRELGARTPFSNSKKPDITPDSENNVAPNIFDPKGLSASLFPAGQNITETLGRTKEGAVGRISIKEVLAKCLIPTLDPKDPSHVLIQPVTKMSFDTYQTLLNSLPWQQVKK